MSNKAYDLPENPAGQSHARYEEEMKKIILTALTMILASGVGAAAGDASRVKVWDKNFQVIKVIDDQISLLQFEKAWKEKKKMKNPPHPRWLYKIDIAGKGYGDRWLYDLNGLVQVLSKAKTPIYIIPNAESFNKLIGAHNLPQEPIR